MFVVQEDPALPTSSFHSFFNDNLSGKHEPEGAMSSAIDDLPPAMELDCLSAGQSNSRSQKQVLDDAWSSQRKQQQLNGCLRKIAV
jgi:hypothetical protein